MIPEIMEDFRVESIAISTISASYLYAYALMQVPVGMMMDRFGARKLLSIAAFICALGCAFYGFAPVYWFLIVGRILLGIGSAFSFLGVVYITSHWFERNKIATLISIGNSLGMIGAIAGEAPLALSVARYGWRTPIIFLGAVGLLLAIVMFYALKADDDCHIEAREEKAREKVDVMENLKSVASNPQSWLIGVGTFLLYSTTTAFAAFWGVPFLASAYGLKTSGASFAISMIFVGWIIGGPIIGKISDRIQHRRGILILCSLVGAACIAIVIYYTKLPLLLLYLFLILVGIFSSAQNLCYCFAIEHNEKKAKGVASAFTNFILFMGAGGIPIIVGALLNSAWKGNVRDGIAVYSPENYKVALTTFPAVFLLAAVVFFFVKKSPIATKTWGEYTD